MKGLWSLRYVLLTLAIAGVVLAVAIKTTSRFPYQIGGAVFCLVLLGALQLWRVRLRNERRGWRLRCVSPRGWEYGEKQNGKWESIVLAELNDYREPPHLLSIHSVERWSEYPKWIHGRREEVLARIRSELREPDYVLKEE